jgi:putative ABC transport system substrate-binding protein
VTAVPVTPTPKNLGMIAVVRLGGSDVGEPTKKDLSDGLKQEALVEGTSYTLTTLEAGGDPARIASTLDGAVKDGAAIVIALGPETARIAGEQITSIPVISYTGLAPPAPLDLGKDNLDHRPRVTGIYSPLSRSNLVAIACGCLPKDKRRLGIVFDPGDPISVAVKDSLATADLDLLTIPPNFETAEVRTSSEIPAAVQSLAKREAKALLMVPGRSIDDRSVIQSASQAKIPVFGYSRAQALGGAVLVRQPNVRWGGFETARCAARVLKGADPQKMPFKEGSLFDTIVNQSAAKTLGFTIPGTFTRTAEMLP